MRTLLPRGGKDLLRQIAIWLGFVVSFAFVSSLAGHRPDQAFASGRRIVDVEGALFGGLPELTFQRVAASSSLLTHATVWTYRNSEFAVISLALLWVYFRRTDAFARFRNTIVVTNLVGLAVYFGLPTAPPRMFPEDGFVDSVARLGGLGGNEGRLSVAENPYAAMPSLHAADALIVGVGLALLVRRPLLKLLCVTWPVWVWFSVMATANHFLLDVVAGAALALVCAAALNASRLRRGWFLVGARSHLNRDGAELAEGRVSA